MSTLTTRIAGYKFVIRTEASGRKFGMFEAENGGKRVTFMDLPFELRSTYSQENGQTLQILSAAVSDVETLRDRVEWTADSHQYDGRPCQCEPCKIASAMFSRTHIVGRKGLI